MKASVFAGAFFLLICCQPSTFNCLFARSSLGQSGLFADFRRTCVAMPSYQCSQTFPTHRQSAKPSTPRAARFKSSACQMRGHCGHHKPCQNTATVHFPTEHQRSRVSLRMPSSSVPIRREKLTMSAARSVVNRRSIKLPLHSEPNK